MSAKAQKRELHHEICRLNDKIIELKFEKSKTWDKLAEIESREYIEKHGITLDQVERSRNNEAQNLRELSSWLDRINCDKPWTEWRGQIHHTRSVMYNLFNPTPVRLIDLEETEAPK